MTTKAPKKIKAKNKPVTAAPSEAELSEDQLEQISGGVNVTADVVSEKLGPDHVVHRHIANVKYEDITTK